MKLKGAKMDSEAQERKFIETTSVHVRNNSFTVNIGPVSVMHSFKNVQGIATQENKDNGTINMSIAHIHGNGIDLKVTKVDSVNLQQAWDNWLGAYYDVY